MVDMSCVMEFLMLLFFSLYMYFVFLGAHVISPTKWCGVYIYSLLRNIMSFFFFIGYRSSR